MFKLVHISQEITPSLNTVERRTLVFVLASTDAADALRAGADNENLRRGRLPVIDLVIRPPENVKIVQQTRAITKRSE
jgi:hypothetical protein